MRSKSPRVFSAVLSKLVKVKNSEAVLEYSMPVLPDKAVIDKDGFAKVVYGRPMVSIDRTSDMVFKAVFTFV